MSSKNMQQDRVAIIGIGLTLPGGAIDPESYWKLLAEKRDATVEIPKDRWDVRRFYSPTFPCKNPPLFTYIFPGLSDP